MKKQKLKKSFWGLADMVVAILVVVFILVFAFSAFMVNYLENEKGSSEYPTLYAEEVKAAAEKYGIEEERIYAVIRVESNFRKDAVSSADARGLMQMLPSTYESQCKRLGIEYNAEDLFDPAKNIDVCTYYLKRMYDMYGDWDHAHAAYNAGYGNVNKWLNNEEYTENGKLIIEKIPFTETRNYVKKVNYYYNEYKLAKASNK